MTAIYTSVIRTFRSNMEQKTLLIIILLVLNSQFGHFKKTKNKTLQPTEKNFIRDFMQYAKTDHKNMEKIITGFFDEDNMDPEAVIDLVMGYAKRYNDTLTLKLATFAPKAIQLYEDMKNLNSSFPRNKCTKVLTTWLQRLKAWDRWALAMLDATAKPQTGLLQGNIVEVGNIDECTEIRATVGNETIKGKYCSTVGNTKKIYQLALPDNMMLEDMDFSYGLCIPDACAEEEINDIVHYISETLSSPFYIHFIEDFCFVGERKPFSTNDLLAILFFSTTGILMLLSTLYDVFVFQKRKETDKQFIMLISFSVYTNWKKIFSTKKTENNLTCLNGLKVISMMWIILGHLYGIVVMMPKANFVGFMQVHESIEGAFPMAANLAVDTFFVVGGILVSYVFLNLDDMKRNINFLWYYLHRFMRLTPSLLALIIFCVTLMDRIAYGPFWTLAVYKIKNTCIKNWWSTLLYVQNYVNPTTMCLSHSWYIAVDMQYCIITPPLLILMRRTPKFTMFIVAAIAILSCSTFFLLTWYLDIGPSAVGVTDLVLKYVYVTPHTRASSWMIGFLFGYVLYSYKSKPLKLSQFTKWSAWTILMGSMTGIVLYHKRFLDKGPWPLLETSLFNSLTRPACRGGSSEIFLRFTTSSLHEPPLPAWSIALCGVIFLCVTGYGDTVNSFLSKPVFTILIRINYNVYLTHVIALVYTYASFKTPYFGEAYRVLVDFWSVYALTLFIALIWTLAFESPFIAIEANLRKKKGPRVENDKPNNISIVNKA